MSAGPLSFTLMVSFMSAITMLGYSAEYYVYGTQLIALYFGVSLGIPVVVYVYLPVFFKLQKTSVYEVITIHMSMGYRSNITVCEVTSSFYFPNVTVS